MIKIIHKRAAWGIHVCLTIILGLNISLSSAADEIDWSAASFISRNSAEVGVADFDKDGNVDIAIASADQRWYAGPDFDVWYSLGDSDGGPYAAQVADINQDGWPDFITSDGERTGTNSGELYVYLNPGAGGDPKVEADWTRITVYSGAVYHQNDLRIADMDGDGRLDIIERTWASQRVVVALQNANINSWTVRVFDTGETGKPEGISAGDIDGDDEMEIVLSGVYWDNPGGWRSGAPVEYLIDSQFQGSTYGKVKSAVGDIDNDGDNDIYMASAEGSDRYLAWYENKGSSVNGGVTLERHIIKDNFGKCHMVQLVDIDRDGDLDIATGRSFGQKGLLVFYNEYTPQDGVSWTEQNYDTTGEIYTGVVADLDGDFDLDVVGPSRFYGGNVRYYKNLTPVDPPQPISIDPTSLDFALAGGTSAVALTTDGDWTVELNDAWLSSNMTAGTGNAAVSITAAAHSGFGDRSGTITFRNINNQVTLTVTQAGLDDTLPPSVPVIDQVSNVTHDSFDLSWSSSADNSGQVQEYVVYLNSFEHSRTSLTSASISGLTELTNYSVQISAVDPSGNESARSDAAPVTTLERPPSPQPLFYWKLNESSGTSTLETINSTNNDLQGMPGDRWVAGKFGNALSFNNDGDDNDRVDLGNIDAPSTALTLSAWINPNDLANNGEGRFLAKATGISENQHFFMLSTIQNGPVFVPRVRLRTNGAVTTLIGSQSENVLEDQWSHVAATYDGSTLNLYLNGVNVGSQAKTGLVNQDDSVLATIGNIPAGDQSGRAFSGLLDDVCIFDLALSPTDIDALYNDGDGATCDNFGEGSTDVTNPVINESLAVTTPTTDTTPSFTLFTNEAGTASFSGDCDATASLTVSAGETIISLTELPLGLIDNCRVVVTDAAGNVSDTLTLSAFEIIEPDTTKPMVTVDRASSQADPTTSNLATFVITFSEPIDASTFSRSDLLVTGTGGAITLGPTALNSLSYSVSVTGMSLNDEVVMTMLAGQVADPAGNLNEAATSTDNSVLYQCNNCIIDDNDNDGIDAALDNCPDDANPDQLDTNNDGVGDACEDDGICIPIKTKPDAVAVICL